MAGCGPIHLERENLADGALRQADRTPGAARRGPAHDGFRQDPARSAQQILAEANGTASPPAVISSAGTGPRGDGRSLGELISGAFSWPASGRGVAQVEAFVGTAASPLYDRASAGRPAGAAARGRPTPSASWAEEELWSAAQVRGAIEIEDRAAGLPGLRRGQVEHGARQPPRRWPDPAERALRADLSPAGPSRRGRHVRLDETGDTPVTATPRGPSAWASDWPNAFSSPALLAA